MRGEAATANKERRKERQRVGIVQVGCSWESILFSIYHACDCRHASMEYETCGERKHDNWHFFAPWHVFRLPCDCRCNDESFGIRAIDVMIDFRGLLFPIAPYLKPTINPGRTKSNKRKCSWSQTENKAHATRRKTPIQI